MLALNYDNGTVKWREDIGPIASASAIAIGGDFLHVTSIDTPVFNIFASNHDTGDELEHMARGVSESSSVLAISDGLLLSVSELGT